MPIFSKNRIAFKDLQIWMAKRRQRKKLNLSLGQWLVEIKEVTKKGLHLITVQAILEIFQLLLEEIIKIDDK